MKLTMLYITQAFPFSLPKERGRKPQNVKYVVSVERKKKKQNVKKHKFRWMT